MVCCALTCRIWVHSRSRSCLLALALACCRSQARQRPHETQTPNLKPIGYRLPSPVDPSFRALYGRLKFTVRRHKFNKYSFSRERFVLFCPWASRITLGNVLASPKLQTSNLETELPYNLETDLPYNLATDLPDKPGDRYALSILPLGEQDHAGQCPCEPQTPNTRAPNLGRDLPYFAPACGPKTPTGFGIRQISL